LPTRDVVLAFLRLSMGRLVVIPLIVGSLGLGPAAARRQLGESRGERKTSTGLTASPLVARYRELARRYRDDARDAEAAASLWASRARAAVYGGRGETRSNTLKELGRQGVTGLAHAVGVVDRMLRDPRPQRAAEAAARAAAPYEEALGEYEDAARSYAATASGYSLRAKNDDAVARQLESYADQHRLQAGNAAAGPFAKQSRLLAKQARDFRDIAAKYMARAKKAREALPDIKRMATAAGAYATWMENADGAVAPHQIYTFTVAPPLDAASGDGK